MTLFSKLPPPKTAAELLLDALGEQYESAGTADEAHAAALRFDRQVESIRDALMEITSAPSRIDAATVMARTLKALRDRSRAMHAEASGMRCDELGDDCRCPKCRQMMRNPVGVR